MQDAPKFIAEVEDLHPLFQRSPLLSTAETGWRHLFMEYRHEPASQMPEVIGMMHGLIMFTHEGVIGANRILDGRRRHDQVAGGDILITPAGIGHESQWDRDGDFILLCLDPHYFAHNALETVDPDHARILPQFATPDPLLCAMGRAIKAAYEQGGVFSRLYIESLTSAIAAHLLHHYSDRQPAIRETIEGLSRAKFQQVTDYIHAHLDQNLGLSELAQVAGMSPHYFSRLFKQSTGMSPHQYVVKCRIDRAKVLLKSGRMAIADVAYAVGFANQSHLNRQFKKVLGITPKAYAQQ